MLIAPCVFFWQSANLPNKSQAQDAASHPGNVGQSVESSRKGRLPWFATYVPSDTAAVARLSSSTLASRDGSRPLYEFIRANPAFATQYGVPLSQIEDFVAAMRISAGKEPQGAVILQVGRTSP